MAAHEKLMDRPIPSLAQWLGDGARSDDFEAYVRDLLAMEQAVADEAEKAMVRIMRTLTIAGVEACRIEAEQHGRDFTDTIGLLARAAGTAVMAPILSVVREDAAAPMDDLVALVARDFRHGAQIMADAQKRAANDSREPR